MGFFLNKKNNGILNVIRCDEPTYLIWKWHPVGTQEGHNTRENAIRFGSSLRVKDGEVAVFVYNQKNGVNQDYIIGPFDKTIKSANLPVLASIVGLAYGGESPFQAEIYFINLSQIIQVKFGVPYFDIYDPRFSDFGVPVSIRGTISFKISDYKRFIKLHRLNSFNLGDFQLQIRDVVSRYVKDAVSNAPAKNNIPLVQIETKIAQITDIIEYDLSERLRENFGVDVSGVDISVIEMDKSSEGYMQLMAVTKDVTLATVQAEKEAKIRNIYDVQRIEAEDYEESLKYQRDENKYARHLQSQSANLAAFQVGQQAEVGIAGANALGHMGENGAGGVNIGDGGLAGGFNPAAMMASVALGGAVGKNIAETMNGIMNNQSIEVTAPPPIPNNDYHIVINGTDSGPFNQVMIAQMISNGQIKGTTLVWKPGMDSWKEASEVDEINKLIIDFIPPTIPE